MWKKTLRSWFFPSILFLISGCATLPFLKASEPLPEISQQDLLDRKADLLDKSIENPAFTMVISIDRFGQVIDPALEWAEEDIALVDVSGNKEGYLYGLTHDGEATLTSNNGECTFICKGKISYQIQGAMVENDDCHMMLWLTPISQPATCTSSCSPSGVTFPGSTGSVGVLLQPIDTNLPSLGNGISTEEEIGNTRWVTNLKMLDVKGENVDEVCNLIEN
jgi:hypothetical protein